MNTLCTVFIFFESFNVVQLFRYDDLENKNIITTEEPEFEPVTLLSKTSDSKSAAKNINCNEFAKYAVNCTLEAATLYNSTSKSPPVPSRIYDWCSAIRYLTNCAIDWNTDCKDVTDSHFNEESIRGHIHVVNSICDDQWFLNKYESVLKCIEASGEAWENCYSDFKILIDEQKNSTREWTHFDTHFHMCCARAQFRRCTLDELFNIPALCPYDQAVTLQKFSVIISEGDVYQDCDHNVMYKNCPGGDPRPENDHLAKYMNTDDINEIRGRSTGHIALDEIFIVIFSLILLCVLELKQI